MSENKVTWHPIEEGYPPELDGFLKYLVTIKYLKCRDIRIVGYVDDLYKFHEYDFSHYKNSPKEEKKGFIEYDSEFGFCKLDHVTAWAYLPEPYKGG